MPADKEVVTLPSGLKYSILTPGTGDKKPKLGDKVKVHYTGWLTDGKVFDSSVKRGQPAEFVLGQVIPGWNEGLTFMTVGSRHKLMIPAKLGYGEGGSPPVIPANAELVFEVELLGITAMPDFKPAKADKQKTTKSGLKYEVLAEGKGDLMKEDELFEVNYALWNTGGKLLDCAEQRGAPIKGRCSDMRLPFFKEALTLMNVGSRYRFEVPAALAFGDKPNGPDLPPNSVTVWELELVKISKPPAVPAFVKPDESKLKKTASGLQHEVIKEGTGKAPTADDQVTVHYAGWLTDGTLFDSSYGRGEPTSFPLGGVIKGWTEGLQLMKEGGVTRFVIPAGLAYGERAMGDKIPPNSTLVFQVELIKVLDR